MDSCSGKGATKLVPVPSLAQGHDGVGHGGTDVGPHDNKYCLADVQYCKYKQYKVSDFTDSGGGTRGGGRDLYPSKTFGWTKSLLTMKNRYANARKCKEL